MKSLAIKKSNINTIETFDTVSDTLLKDKYCNIDALLNKSNKMDGLALLDLISDNSVKTTFFDPQYRGVLDKK